MSKIDKKQRSIRRFFWLLCLFCAAFLSGAPTDSPLSKWYSDTHPASGHNGLITALANAADAAAYTPEAAFDEAETDEAPPADNAAQTGYVLTAGEDGFLVIWSVEERKALERYQLSASAVTLLKSHPKASELAYIESAGAQVYRLSVLNYWTKARLFSLTFASPPSFIDYSPQGTYLIVCTGERTIRVLDSRTGEDVRPPIETGAVYAAASPTERTLLVYAQGGRLSYWNIQSGKKTAEFSTVSSLSGALVFRNYNLLAGWLGSELYIINAANGKTLLRSKNIPYGNLLPVASAEQGADEQFAVLSQNALTLYSLDNAWQLVKEKSFEAEGGTALAGAGGFFLGLQNGRLAMLSESGGRVDFAVSNQMRVSDAVIDNKTLRYRTENGAQGEMPADYRAILDGALVSLPPSEGGQWTAARFPVDALLGRLLFIEAAGPVVRSRENEERVLFRASLPFTTCAQFVDERTIIAASLAAGGANSLRIIKMNTGETAPVELQDAEVRNLRRGKSGEIYVIAGSAAGDKTRILKLNAQNPRSTAALPRLIEVSADSDADLAENGASLVTNLGDTRINFYSASRGTLLFSGEVSGSFPMRILDGGENFIVIDSEGSIVWFNGATGRIEAVLRFFENEWEISAADGRRAAGQ